MSPDPLLPPSNIQGNEYQCSAAAVGWAASPFLAGSARTGDEQRAAIRWGVLPGGCCGGSGATRAAAAFPQHHRPASPSLTEQGLQPRLQLLNKPPGR